MRKLIPLLVMAFMVAGLGLSGVVRAYEAKEVTLTGTGACAKCELNETTKCQNVVIVEKEGKKTTYYFTANDVAKKFHSNVCQGTKKIKVTGTVEEKDGKMQLTATKAEVVE